MNSYIKHYNALQTINREIGESDRIDLPQIVVIGSQSAGKSSVLESIIGKNLFPKGKDMVTRCPLRLELMTSTKPFEAKFRHKNDVIVSESSIIQEIKIETDKRTKTKKSISKEEIVLEITGLELPTLTLVDLPGMICNLSDDQPSDLDQQIRDLIKTYIKPKNTIILAISPANADLATSEAVRLASDVDPEGSRTIHVLTKLDLLNDEEIQDDQLRSEYLRKSVAVIYVINRNQKDNLVLTSISDQRQKEQDFLKKHCSAMAPQNGTPYLVSQLAKFLIKSLKEFIPNFEVQINQKISEYEIELSHFDPRKMRNLLIETITQFRDLYEQALIGTLDSYSHKIEGGALISILLYKTFTNQMKQLSLNSIEDSEILIAIKNTTGSSDVSFSFEKPFKHLIANELQAFYEPTNACVMESGLILEELIPYVFGKMNRNQCLHERIRCIARTIIADRIKECECKVKDYIKSEIIDITFTNPYNQMLNDLRNYPTIPRKDGDVENSLIRPDMIKTATSLIPAASQLTNYFPYVTMAITAYGLYTSAKNAFDAGNHNEIINILQGVNWDAIGLQDKKDDIIRSIEQNSEGFINTFMNEQSADPTDSCKQGMQQLQCSIIKNLMKSYFNMVRNNIINYVPKTIQVFLLHDIWKEMHMKMQLELLEDSTIESLLSGDGMKGRSIELQNNLQKSNEIKDLLGQMRSLPIG